MELLIRKFSGWNEFEKSKLSAIESITSEHSPFLPWLLLVLLLNRTKWRRTIIYILIAYWFLNFITELNLKIYFLFPKSDDNPFPFTGLPYRITNALYSIFLFISEIVGDWYLLLRTTAITGNRRIYKLYVICLIFNVTKIYGAYFMVVVQPPFSNKDLFHYGLVFFVIQVTNIVYDATNIHYLRKIIFNKINKATSNKSNFIELLKCVSEYRLIASMILSIIVTAILTVSLTTSYFLSSIATSDDDKQMDHALAMNIRYDVMRFNYFLMYIDQILLRFYAERNNPSCKISSTNSYMFRKDMNFSPYGSNTFSSSKNNQIELDNHFNFSDHSSNNSPYGTLEHPSNNHYDALVEHHLNKHYDNMDHYSSSNRYDNMNQYSSSNRYDNVNQYSSSNRYDNVNQYSSSNRYDNMDYYSSNRYDISEHYSNNRYNTVERHTNNKYYTSEPYSYNHFSSSKNVIENQQNTLDYYSNSNNNSYKNHSNKLTEVSDISSPKYYNESSETNLLNDDDSLFKKVDFKSFKEQNPIMYYSKY